MADRFDQFHGQVTAYPFTFTGTDAVNIVPAATGVVQIPVYGYITCGGGSTALSITDTGGTSLSNGTAGGMMIDKGIVFGYSPYGVLKASTVSTGINMQSTVAGATLSGCLMVKAEKQSYS